MRERIFTLSYEGKREEEEILRLLAPKPRSFQDITSLYIHGQEMEEVEKPGKYFLGENTDVLRHLLTEEDVRDKVQLVYIDPPYGTGQVFSLDKRGGGDERTLSASLKTVSWATMTPLMVLSLWSS